MICLILGLNNMATLSALELGASYRIGNLSLDQVTDTGFGTFNGKDFSSWGLSFWGSHLISDKLKMDAGFYSDPILRRISYTLFSYTESFLSIGVGPFFGFFNADLNTILKSGISTSIRIEIPTLLFLSFRTDSSLASRLVIPLDYIQERTDLSLGFYVANAICSLNVLSKKFTQVLEINTLTYEVLNALNEYSFVTHLFQKNVPYRITLKFAYQSLSKQFIETSDTITSYILNSIIVGTKLEVDLTEAMLLYIDMDNSVYTFGREELANTAIAEYAFRGSAGLKINLDKLMAKPVQDDLLRDF